MKIMGINQGYSNNNLSSQTTFTSSINQEIKNSIRKAMNNNPEYDYKKIINSSIKHKTTKLQHSKKLAELKKAFNTTPIERRFISQNPIDRPHVSNLRNDNTSLSEAIKNNVDKLLHEKKEINYKELLKPLITRKPTTLQHTRKLADLKKAFSLKSKDGNKVLDMQPMPKAKRILNITESNLKATTLNSEDFLAKVINPLINEEPSILEHKIRERKLNQAFDLHKPQKKYVIDMIPTDEASEIIESTAYKINKSNDVNYKDIIESRFTKQITNHDETQQKYDNLFKKNIKNNMLYKFYTTKIEASKIKNKIFEKYQIKQKATKAKSLLKETMRNGLASIRNIVQAPYHRLMKVEEIIDIREMQRQNMKNFFSHKYAKKYKH